jgi:hypothetical protein
MAENVSTAKHFSIDRRMASDGLTNGFRAGF